MKNGNSVFCDNCKEKDCAVTSEGDCSMIRSYKRYVTRARMMKRLANHERITILRIAISHLCGGDKAAIFDAMRKAEDVYCLKKEE
jgi:hypothetical protein